MAFRHALPYTPDASGYCAALRELGWAAWLDSGGRDRYDILTAAPYATLVTRGGQTEIRRARAVAHSATDPFELLRSELGAPLAPLLDVPFAGGALGYWGYDLARRLMNLPEQAQDTEQLPEMAIGLYDWALVLDHRHQRAELVSHLRRPETETFLTGLAERLMEPIPPSPPLLKGGKKPVVAASPPFAKGGLGGIPAPLRVLGPIHANFSRDSYQAAFDAIQRYLHAGDCYQVNLAQRFAAAAEGDAWAAYLSLREISPAPFAAFLDLPQAQVLCASPERFLRVQNGQVETKPIKGTRPRNADPAEDARLADELRRHPKDRAENLMIVDLLRNDLGRRCLPGSVRTPKLFEVESYTNVHHLVSTVTGTLAPCEDALSLLRACFPGGSITGAPKQRAMQIIEELEPHRRGVYCGAIGYVGFDGGMDCNITIRTLVYANGEIRGWAGGGIVADSQADAEYRETLDKANAMLKVLEQFSRTDD